jgi:hypothetical protein
VLNTSWANELFWGDMFVAWVFKAAFLRYGGRRLYSAALPFFLGLILGDFVTGSGVEHRGHPAKNRNLPHLPELKAALLPSRGGREGATSPPCMGAVSSPQAARPRGL